jgi:hypothetical protein
MITVSGSVEEHWRPDGLKNETHSSREMRLLLTKGESVAGDMMIEKNSHRRGML